MIASFQINNIIGKSQFFQEIFMLTDIDIEIILDILLLIFSNADIKFIKQKFP